MIYIPNGGTDYFAVHEGWEKKVVILLPLAQRRGLCFEKSLRATLIAMGGRACGERSSSVPSPAQITELIRTFLFCPSSLFFRC